MGISMMDYESNYAQLNTAFLVQKDLALSFIEKYNAKLPSEKCPSCGDTGHVPGLRCPACGYRHHTAWAILRGGEWGYEVVALTNRRKILAEFRVE